MKGELIAGSQKLPLKFVENILGELKHAGSSCPSAGRKAATSWPSRQRR